MTDLKFIDVNVTDENYEYVSRKNKNKVVIIIPVLIGDYEDKYQLIVQERPVFNQKVLLFPAGLIDNGLSSVEAAIRLLLEETQWRYNFDRHKDVIGVRIIQENCPTSCGLTDELADIILLDLKYFHKVSIEDSLKSGDQPKIEVLHLMTLQDIKNFTVINEDVLVSSRAAMLMLKEI